MFKTALATLCEQHFGASMDASSLPANFASTSDALVAHVGRPVHLCWRRAKRCRGGTAFVLDC